MTSFQFPSFAKAIVAAVLTAAGPTIAAAQTPQGVTPTSTWESVGGLIAGGLVTYFTPNGKKALSDLAVVVKPDLTKFLNALAAGLPALVQSAMQTALAADPAPAAPVADPLSPTVGTTKVTTADVSQAKAPKA